MSEIASNSYAHFAIPRPEQPLVHVHPDPLELGRVYQPVLAINATPGAFLDAVAETRATAAWSDARAALRDAYCVWSDQPAPLPGDFQYGEVMAWLRDRLPDDAIICHGAGNYAGWIQRSYRSEERRVGKDGGRKCRSRGGPYQ